MDTQLLLSPKWWAEHCASLPEVFSVERQQGDIRQKNSFIQFLLLRLSNGQDLSVVAKLVNLAQNQYRQAEVRLPAAVYIRWEPEDAGLTVILQDLRALPAPGGTSSLTVAPGTPGLRHGQFHALTQLQAEAALAWLARFHAAFWGARVAVCAEEHGLWCQGGYWTLEKRQPDLHRMPAEWRRTVASFAGSFPQVFQCPSVQTANIFLAQAEGQAWTASACDYQWTGGGLGVRDVVYLIWTSVSGAFSSTAA
eukprot:jgi/Astpho2/1529/fgenesh1_pg.00026_%23_25_t